MYIKFLYNFFLPDVASVSIAAFICESFLLSVPLTHVEDDVANKVEFFSKLVISVTEHLVEVVGKLSTTAVVFFRSERILKCKHLYGV